MIFATSATKNQAILRAILRITVTNITVGVLALKITYFRWPRPKLVFDFLGKRTRDDEAPHENKSWVSDLLRKPTKKKNVMLSIGINAG